MKEGINTGVQNILLATRHSANTRPSKNISWPPIWIRNLFPARILIQSLVNNVHRRSTQQGICVLMRADFTAVLGSPAQNVPLTQLTNKTRQQRTGLPTHIQTPSSKLMLYSKHTWNPSTHPPVQNATWHAHPIEISAAISKSLTVLSRSKSAKSTRAIIQTAAATLQKEAIWTCT